MKNGRYGKYAISDGLVNKAVFLDYNTYWKRLQDRNLRKTVPPFDPQESYRYCLEGKNKVDNTGGTKDKAAEQRKLWTIRFSENELLSFYGTKKEAEKRAKEYDKEFMIV